MGKGRAADIYISRPTDCRVFPYVTTHVIEKRNKIKITFHSRSDCPKKDRLYLLMPEAEIRMLLTEFVRKTFGEKKTIIVLHEDEVASRLRNRIKAALGRQWDRIIESLTNKFVIYCNNSVDYHVFSCVCKKCRVPFMPR